MYKKIIGSIFMILGTSVGAGMLALPVVTAQESFTTSFIILLGSWLMMTIGALSLLEVNLWLPANTNMISMADKTLGHMGKVFTWIIYLLLLYSLVCAYLSGLSDILVGLSASLHITLPHMLAVFISLGLCSAIVYRGIHSVSMVNLSLMIIKLLSLIILIFILSSHSNLSQVFSGDHRWHSTTIMVMLTSFGYAIIIPSLRTYLNTDKRKLCTVILISSLIPFVLYAAWIFVIQGFIPKDGPDGLIKMLSSSQVNTALMTSVSVRTQAPWITAVAKLFISICAATSFLGVSVCLIDFLADGLKLNKHGGEGLFVYTVAYLPPLLLVLLAPGMFIAALNYAGALCLLLLIIIPLLMLYRGRYQKQQNNHLILPNSKGLIVFTLIIALILLGISLV